MGAALSAAQAADDFQARTKEQPRAAPNPEPAARVNDALTALAAFIPAEAISLFLLVCSTFELPKHEQIAWTIFWIFVFLVSPGLFVLAFLTKLAANDSNFPKFLDVPWSRIASASLAFFAWGLCVPSFPVWQEIQPFTGVLAISIAILLPAIDTIYNWWVRRRLAADGALKP